MTILRLALLFCPREFREQYGSAICDDAKNGGVLHAVADAIVAGMSMRFENGARDLRLAVRSLRKAPLYSVVVITTIGLAIGVNLSIGAVIEGVLLRPLPYDHAERLLFVQETNQGNSLSYPDATVLAARMRSYGTIALSESDGGTLLGRGRPIQLSGAVASADYFSVVGLHPSLGRFFSNGSADRRAAVISYDLWRQRYSGSIATLGQILNLDGRAYTIIGVAPPGFLDPTPYGLVHRSYWVRIDPNNTSQIAPSNFSFNALARIRPGVDMGTSAASIGRIVKSIADGNTFDPPSKARTIQLTPVIDRIVGPMRPLLWLLYAAVTVVLIIACVNVANLQLTRTMSRGGELAVRAALGAPWKRIVSHVAAETAVLSCAGALVGTMLAWLGLRCLSGFGAKLLPRWNDVHVDGPLLVYATALILVTTLVAGVLPALPRRRQVRRSMRFARVVLVVGEIALATAVVLAAGLVLNSYRALTNVELGFDPRSVFLVQTSTPTTHEHVVAGEGGAPGGDLTLRFVQNVMQQLRTIDGVQAVSAALEAPFDCCDQTDVAFPGSSQEIKTFYDAVTPAYFRTLQIGLVLGRMFAASDRAHAPCVAIVNESFARSYLGDTGAIGRVISPGIFDTPRSCAVVGVVRNAVEEYGRAAVPILYVPMAQHPELREFVVRLGRPNPNLASRIDRIFAASYPTLAAPSIVPEGSLIAAKAFAPLTIALVFAALAAIALILAIAGTYAVVSFSVEQRTHEFGIRKALGARTISIVADVTAAALVQCTVGMIIGMTLAAWAARQLGGILFGSSTVQPPVYITVMGVVVISAAVAAIVPALRAALLDPARALRYE